MNDEEKLKTYIELYKVKLERFDKRRNFEWKVTIGLWTGLSVLTGFLAGKIQLSLFHLVFYIAVWGIFTFVWTRGSWCANEKDMQYAHVYRNHVENLIGHTTEKYTFQPPDWKKCFTNWSRLSQILTTALIMFMSWYYLTLIPVRMDQPQEENDKNKIKAVSSMEQPKKERSIIIKKK